ncbi:MAG TPA: thiolase family protein [Bacteroidetes bacterium]|nr:thiolase family protein [Bacteroidota bacterium]
MNFKQNEVVVVSAARTPIGKHCGYYYDFSAEDLGVLAVQEAILRSGIDLSKIKIEQIVAGMIYTDSLGQKIYLPRNVAYRAAKLLGDEDNLKVAPGKTTLRICGTGFQTLADAFDLIHQDGPQKMNCVVSFATESMTNTNLVHQGKRKKDNVWDFEDAPLKDYLLEGFSHYYFNTQMALTAEKYGTMLGVSRKDCDEFSYESHIRAREAQKQQWNRYSGKNKNDYLKGVFTVNTEDMNGIPVSFWRDEGVKYDISVEELAGLRPLMKADGLVTPGTASQISDGAAAAVLMDREFADKNNIPYLAVIRGYQFSTVDPTIMGQGPVPAIKTLMKKLKMKMADVDLFEINEAFAAQYLAAEKELKLPREITNVNGGAVAIGHNIAATGLRITTDLIYELKRRKEKTGIASACIGGGQGGAVCVEIV